jgi:glycerate kinase
MKLVEIHEAMRVMKPTGHCVTVIMLDGKEGWIEAAVLSVDGLCRVTVEAARGRIDTRWVHHEKLEVVRNQLLREVA